MGNKNSTIVSKTDHFVVEIISATNVPKADTFSESDPFVKLWVNTNSGEPKGNREQTLHRRDAANPVWNAYRDMHCSVEHHDKLHVEIWDYDFVKQNEQLAHLDILISDIHADPRTFTLDKKIDKDNGKDCTITLRIVPYVDAVTKKTIFLIRHGESKWNAAQEEKNIGAMLHFDHGLNKDGVEQAQALNKAWKAEQAKFDSSSASNSYVTRFLSPNARVFASPLTRASETALLALHGHPAIKNSLRLLWTIRETKGLGGLDTVGKAVGDEIQARVITELTEVVGESDAKDIVVPFEIGACVTAWWTQAEIKDTKKMLDERYHDLICTLKYSPFETAILVGHSLFWRNLCKRYVGDVMKMKDKQFAKDLAGTKMENAACLALDFDFELNQIVGAEFLFGTKFVQK